VLDEWTNLFHINSEVRFGPIIDKNRINLFYDEDIEVKKMLNNLKSMIESENDYRSIMIAGHAGVGKTTSLYFIKDKLGNSKYDLFIINGEENNSEYGIIEDINIKFKYYYRELFINVEKGNQKIDTEIKAILDSLFADIEYCDTLEKHKLYLTTYDKLCDNIAIFNSSKIKKIRIALDQIDLLDSAKMLKILHDNFTQIIHSKYITAIISARNETLDSAKKSINNFFATNFNRHISMSNVPVEFILKKRLEASSKSKSIPMQFIKSYFSDSFFNFLNGIQNGNIRKALSIIEHIMNVIHPVNKGRESTIEYINFLLSNDYIDDLFMKINPGDSIPMIKMVFDALQFQSVVNDKFYQVISAKAYMLTRNCQGCSKMNMNSAISFLKNRSLIVDTFDIPDRYFLTAKGEIYKELILTKPYNDLFCKSKQDILFMKNQFDETLFL
jgi:Cdc6-like AAA superfamily ATPase